jgi:hypothetical protein
MGRIFEKNPIIFLGKYRISLPNLPPFQKFFAQNIISLAEEVLKRIDSNRTVVLKYFNVYLDQAIERNVSEKYITDTFQLLFPYEQINFTEIKKLCRNNKLKIPHSSKEPSEFVFDLILNNGTNPERIKNLPIKGSLFTRWIVLSLRKVVGGDYLFKFVSKKSVLETTLSKLLTLPDKFADL